jgi:hypothetical protein
MKDPVLSRKDGVGVRKYYRRSQDRNANNESGKGSQTRQMRLGYNKVVLFTLGNSFFYYFITYIETRNIKIPLRGGERSSSLNASTRTGHGILHKWT